MDKNKKRNDMEEILKKINEYYPNDENYNKDLAKELCVLFSVSKCEHEPKPYKGKWANCKHCDTILQMKP